MARKLRIEYPGATYHITARGNKRGDVFLCDDDRRAFLQLLTKTADRFGWLVAAYCLMDNHYHLLVKTLQASLSRGMHWLNGVYTQRFNSRHGQVGHLFQGRYGDSLVQNDRHMQAVSRYINLNPVEAHLVERPEDWKWSGYRATIGLERPADCLDTDLVLNDFGEHVDRARKEYAQFVLAGIGLDEEKMMSLPIIGDDDFIKSHQEMVGHRTADKEYPIAQRFLNRPTLPQLFPAIEKVRGKAKEMRDRKIVEAVDKYGYRQNEIAKYLNIHYSRLSKIAKSAKGKT